MRIHNAAISAIFNQLADLLEIKGENPFRIRAYRAAGRTINGLSQDITEMLSQGQDLSKLPGIGKDLAHKIEEIVNTGHLSVLDEAEKELDPELVKWMSIAGLGGKRVAAINSMLGIVTLDQLEKAARDHQISKLPGFGEKVERSILEGIAQSREALGKIMLFEAEEIARLIEQYLSRLSVVKSITVAGSFRRRKETVRDIDILVTGNDSVAIVNHFLAYPGIVKIISRGETRNTVIIQSGIQVDVRIVPEESYGAAIHYFTGSKAHNIGIRKRGVRLGLKINEYGVYRGNKLIGGKYEEDVYRAVKLPFIEPELREDSGELEAAEQGRLPALVKLSDIRGDLHAHTIRTDGHATIEQMVSTAMAKGYSYLAITDHSQHLAMTHGLTERDLAEQIDQINRVNLSLNGFTVLKGIEVDILENGKLDLPDSILKELDLTVCSVHYKLNLPRKEQTERVLRAMDNRYFRIFAHPTGRLINRRPPYEIDMEKIVMAAKERGCILEVNSSPDRLDLTDIHCRLVKNNGVKVSIDTDAHSTSDLDLMRFGIGQARRGWIEKEDVINTLELGVLRQVLKR